jgi:hypothetical protein
MIFSGYIVALVRDGRRTRIVMTDHTERETGFTPRTLERRMKKFGRY